MSVLVVFLACGSPPPSTPPAPAAGSVAPTPVAVRSTDVQGLQQALAERPRVLLDVRTPGEYAAGHVPGAVNLPLAELDRNAPVFAGHDQDEIYVICEVGGRSARASSQLAEWGLHPVDLKGGTAAWRAAGLPVE
jgi:rhodanese-related sulfurtransferase